MLTSFDAVRRLRSHFQVYVLSRLLEEDEQDRTPVTILIPLHPKDLQRVAASIRALAARLAHRIERIVIATTNPAELEPLRGAIPVGLKLDILDEKSLLPASVLEGSFVMPNGENRRGWVRQQFLKLSWPDFIDAERTLTMDADTKPARRLSFMDREGRSILYTSDEYSKDYFASVQRILGPMRRAPWSFVSHCMLFERDLMLAMRRHIEARHGVSWDEAIIRSLDLRVTQFLSEYELYGNYCYRFWPERVSTRYFLNKKICEEEFVADEIAAGRRRFRLLSSHYTTTHYEEVCARNEGLRRERPRDSASGRRMAG